MLAGTTAFVTGGTGFIGGRLIEVLSGQFGVKVRALVRRGALGSGAFRAAAAGAEFVGGSLLDEAGLTEAMRGCDYVFHCAFGSGGDLAEQRKVTVEGTRTLARAAAAAGVRHLVNLSTVITFGADTPALVDEDYVMRRAWDWPYATDKRDAERALAEEHARSGLAVTSLRLGVVYGPYGPAFTLGPLAALQSGRVALVDDGQGVTSTVYVDDVVQAMLLAARRSPGKAEIFSIRGPGRVTWRDFYQAYADMLGIDDGLVAMSGAEMRAERRRATLRGLRRMAPEALAALKASPGFKRAAGSMPLVRTLYGRLRGPAPVLRPAVGAASPSPERPIHLLPDMMIGYYAATTEYSIERARTELGYTPQFDFVRGIALTEQWARWANLIRS